MSGVGNDVPGAGVDPAKVINGTKRLKKMHRASEGELSFKAPGEKFNKKKGQG